MKKVVLIFFLLKNLSFYSQTCEVKDFLTKEPLPFATIILDNENGVYTNGLRIDFLLSEITNNNDSEFLRLSIEGIAKDFGFNNSVAFSRAFKKQKGTNLAIFLKELHKRKSV